MTPSMAISNFNFEEVPAPLPALSAFGAFAYSRRLRRRIHNRAQHPRASQNALTGGTPAHLPRPLPAINLSALSS